MASTKLTSCPISVNIAHKALLRPGKAYNNMSRKPAKKQKWTDRMNQDLIECKRSALEMTSSENPPRNENGRKRGYIEVMKELWDEKGYEHLGIKAQNLRDQASRLEKLQGSASNVLEESQMLNAGVSQSPPESTKNLED